MRSGGENGERVRVRCICFSAHLPLKQPCPPSSMDMTLVSTNKFIGAHSMACSKGYVVVLTKEVTSLSSSQENAYASNWFL